MEYRKEKKRNHHFFRISIQKQKIDNFFVKKLHVGKRKIILERRRSLWHNKIVQILCSGIEVVITGLTRNQFASNRTRVRIPPAAPKEEQALKALALLFYILQNFAAQNLLCTLDVQRRFSLFHSCYNGLKFFKK